MIDYVGWCMVWGLDCFCFERVNFECFVVGEQFVKL